MALIYNGSEINSLMWNGAETTGVWNGEVVWSPIPPSPEPIVLPAYTIRVKFKSGYTPTMGDTQTLVDSTNNVWDIYKSSNSWNNLFAYSTNLLEVIGANTTNVTTMTSLFDGCSSLTSVPLFDTSNVTTVNYMFSDCSSLTTIPLFDTSKVTAMIGMFYNCVNVQSGALALYQQASTQAKPPSKHTSTFYNCGKNTETGAAELAQIPSSWGGTGT